MTEELDKLCRDAANIIDLDVLGTAERLYNVVRKITGGDDRERESALIELGAIRESMIRECPKARKVMEKLREGRLREPEPLSDDLVKEIGDLYIDMPFCESDLAELEPEDVKRVMMHVADMRGRSYDRCVSGITKIGKDFTIDTSLPDGLILKNGKIEYYPGSDQLKKKRGRPKKAEPKKRGRKPKVKE